jgi:hypothetical protein
MPGRVNAAAGEAIQRFIMFQPVFRRWHGCIRYAKHSALLLKRVPQEQIVLVQANSGTRLRLQLPGRQYVIEVRVGVDQGFDTQAQPGYGGHDVLGIAPGVYYVPATTLRITNDGAIALEWANRKTIVNYIHIISLAGKRLCQPSSCQTELLQ